jgi:hypothetical protein
MVFYYDRQINFNEMNRYIKPRKIINILTPPFNNIFIKLLVKN